MTFNRGHTAAAKLTPEQVLELRQRYNAGWTQGRLSREYQVSIGQIGRIVRGEAWQQYTQEPHPDALDDSIARLKLMGVPIAAEPPDFTALFEPEAPRVDAVAEYLKLRGGIAPPTGTTAAPVVQQQQEDSKDENPSHNDSTQAGLGSTKPDEPTGV